MNNNKTKKKGGNSRKKERSTRKRMSFFTNFKNSCVKGICKGIELISYYNLLILFIISLVAIYWLVAKPLLLRYGIDIEVVIETIREIADFLNNLKSK